MIEQLKEEIINQLSEFVDSGALMKDPEEEQMKAGYSPREMMVRLRKELVAALEYDCEDYEALRRQSKALDRAFRFLMGEGAGIFGNMKHFAAAFRAQNQFRSSLDLQSKRRIQRKQQDDTGKTTET
jgi:hypothetical protein